jgi:hypothetical protein
MAYYSNALRNGYMLLELVKILNPYNSWILNLYKMLIVLEAELSFGNCIAHVVFLKLTRKKKKQR